MMYTTSVAMRYYRLWIYTCNTGKKLIAALVNTKATIIMLTEKIAGSQLDQRLLMINCGVHGDKSTV